jgi:hypothetical protein
VQECQVADHRERRAAVSQRRPDGRGRGAVDATGAAAGQDAQIVPRRKMKINVPNGQA